MDFLHVCLNKSKVFKCRLYFLSVSMLCWHSWSSHLIFTERQVPLHTVPQDLSALSLQNCHRHIDRHIQEGMTWVTESDLQASPRQAPIERHLASSHPDLAGKRNIHTCFGAAKWFQLLFPAPGNHFDQRKGISSCNANAQNVETSCEMLWEMQSLPQEMPSQRRTPKHTVWLSPSEMDLHFPSFVFFNTKK